MSRPVSLFSGYSQKENRVTNYALLVLKMLYEENPKYLGEVLATLFGEDVSDHIGVAFRQQERRGASIPDGLIVQRAVTVYIETKNYDWFRDEQLENHLLALDRENVGLKVLLALGNFESPEVDQFGAVRSICDRKYKGSILFRAVSFEQLLDAVEIAGLPKNLADTIFDFKAFLNEEDLLPSWRERLDVVNCAGIPEDITRGGVYMCPARGGAYTHDRCRFFGMYRRKRVELVSEIEAVVDVDPESEAMLLWKNVATVESELLGRARKKVIDLRPGQGVIRVFLLGPLFPTEFRKDSPGGMQSSKRYFNIASIDANNAEDLAQRLRGRAWSEFV
jgi:hypothetical protein